MVWKPDTRRAQLGKRREELDKDLQKKKINLGPRVCFSGDVLFVALPKGLDYLDIFPGVLLQKKDNPFEGFHEEEQRLQQSDLLKGSQSFKVFFEGTSNDEALIGKDHKVLVQKE